MVLIVWIIPIIIIYFQFKTGVKTIYYKPEYTTKFIKAEILEKDPLLWPLTLFLEIGGKVERTQYTIILIPCFF